MKMVRFSSGHRPSLTQMAARKQLRKHIRRIREREYSKLRALVPAVASKKKVTKVQVIEEAVRYIEELHAALVERFRQKHGCGAESMVQETVRSFVCQMMPPVRPHPSHAPVFIHPPRTSASSQGSSQLQPHLPAAGFLSSCSYEKQRKRASFLLKKRRKDC